MSLENIPFRTLVANNNGSTDCSSNIYKRSSSSMSEDNFSSHNFTPKMASPQRLQSLSALSFCTGERKRKHRKDRCERKEKLSHCCNSSSDSFGFSKNLSSESLRRECECFEDDVSDNDLIEVDSTPGSFQRYRSGGKRCLGDGKLFINLKNSDESPLYIGECSSNELIASQRDDAFDALQELDAVLDSHDSTQQNSGTKSDNERSNIEDCLLDLDNYLDKMDNSVEEGSIHSENIFNTKNVLTNKEELSLQRGHNLRRTMGCITEKNLRENVPCLNPVYGTLSRGNPRIVNDCLHIIDINEQNIKNVDNGTHYHRKNDSPIEHNLQHGSIPKADVSDIHNANCQTLTDEQIFQNIIEQQARHSIEEDPRPRQYGRRGERNSRVSMPNIEDSDATLNNNSRPMSAPAVAPLSLSEQHYSSPRCNASDESTVRSSRNTSPVTIVSSTDSSDSYGTLQTIAESSVVIREECSRQALSAQTDLGSEPETTEKPGFNAYWPHSYSRTMALISCSLGLFNICRFAVLTINYGANFLIQFLLLSLIFGIPFFWLQMCLGAKIRAGPVSMWKISPICSGIGISLVLVQYFLAIYSSVVIIWLLVYIGDTIMFQSSYRWAETSHILIPRNESQIYYNITESIPEYFNINVLQRLQILRQGDSKGVRIHISDRLAFYLVVLWAIVFLILCRGLKSFGKVVFIIGTLPLITMTVVAGKLLCAVNLKKIQSVFSASELDDFLINSKTWTAAAQETFFTWGLLGASVIAITSRRFKSLSTQSLRRDALLVAFFTLFGLSLSAIMGLCCIQILNQAGYVYVPGSYEKPGYYSAVYSLKSSMRSDIISYPPKYVPHYSSLVGEIYRRHVDVKHISGYQVLRFVTELFPAVVIIGSENISWIWVAVVILMLFVFGVAQLCAMWKPISSALGNSTSSVLLSCVTGLLLSIPFATEVGISLLHYLDILIGGSWFIPILWAAEIFGVFLIRGRPYNGDDLVNDLKMSGSMSAFLALSWNVLIPISLIAFSIIEYKVSLSSQLYYWRGRSYYAYWARKLGALTQIAFLLLVPITAIIQIYRYLTTGPPDILDRIQMLYRPFEDFSNTQAQNRVNRERLNTRFRETNRDHTESSAPNIQDDAPPKYTPPPSYSTATGARIAKIFRQSIRRSVRRLLGGTGRSRPILQIEHDVDRSRCPPEYSSVLPNPSASSQDNAPSISESIEITNRANPNAIYGRSLSLGRTHILKKQRPCYQANNIRLSSEPRHIIGTSNELSHCPSTDRPYTAEDVITILRSSSRVRNGSSHLTNSQNPVFFRSFENLVLNAEPPGISSNIASEQLTKNYHHNTSVI